MIVGEHLPPPLLLRTRGLSKAFSATVKAIDDVSFDLRAGQVHALVGENGAGKSTFSRIVAGLTGPDAGEMFFEGEFYSPRDRADAESRGVRMVTQELNTIGTLSVAESIFVGRMPHRLGVINYRRMNEDSRRIMKTVGLDSLDPTRPMASLGVGQRQMVEIAAGISQKCSVLILDEPTAALTDPEIDLLYGQIEKLKGQGVGIIYISHRMGEIKRICDRVTILRDGRVVAAHDPREISTNGIIKLMVGRDPQDARAARRKQSGEIALKVRNLRRGEAIKDVSFDLHKGEILGFAGLMGSGRTETMRAVFGADPVEAGAIYVDDSSAALAPRGPRDAVRAGVALLTEDRKEEGLFLPLSIRANITLPRLAGVSRAGWLDDERERATADSFVRALGIRCASAEQRAGELSGGNQQKVVIAKWMYRDARIFIFDEPTRGIDVGAKFEIYRKLDELARIGKAIIVVSSELEELIGLCDRICVMSAGRLVATFGREQFDRELIMTAALSGYAKEV